MRVNPTFAKRNYKGHIITLGFKAAAAHRWCSAVNSDGRFKRWSHHFVRQPPDLLKVLNSVKSLDSRMRQAA